METPIAIIVICAIGLLAHTQTVEALFFKPMLYELDYLVKIEMLFQIGFQLIVMPHTTTHVL